MELNDLLDDVLDSYVEGCSEMSPSIERGVVRFGVVGNLVIRSAFTAVPLELLGDVPTDELAMLFDRRARYARFLVDLGLALVPDLGARI